MTINIYSDESGVFDREHNKIFVFAGLILIGDDEKQNCVRRFLKAEHVLRKILNTEVELKESVLEPKYKMKLFRSLNQYRKFCCIIDEQRILEQIYRDKKTKQRYLDYAYKIAVKKALESYIYDGVLNPDDVDTIYFHTDEHTTATNGRYELREALEQEFRFGTYNRNYSRFFPPIFPNTKHIELDLCDSTAVTLVRAADIIANRVYFLANSGERTKLREISNLNIVYLP